MKEKIAKESSKATENNAEGIKAEKTGASIYEVARKKALKGPQPQC